MKIIDKYLAKLLIKGFTSSLGIVAGLLILQRFYKIIELAVARSLNGWQTANLVLWTLPLVFFYSLPIASVVGTLLTVGKLSGDAELNAAMAAGISRFRMARFPIFFAIIISSLALLNNMVLMPTAYVRFDDVGFGVGVDPMLALRPGIVERISGRHIVLGSIDGTNKTFTNLFTVVPAEDAGHVAAGGKLMLMAAEGNWRLTPEAVSFFLVNGSIREISGWTGKRESGSGKVPAPAPSTGVTPAEPVRVLKFGSYQLNLPLPRDKSTEKKRLTVDDLLSTPTQDNLMELARRALEALSIPLLVLCAIPLAMPRGAAAARGTGSRGVIWLTFLLYFMYWILTFASESVVLKYALTPLALAAPHLALAVISILLWRSHT